MLPGTQFEALKTNVLEGIFQIKVAWFPKVPRAGQVLLAWGGVVLDSEGFLNQENLNGLKIKATFYQISSKACCGSDQLEQLPLSLPETTAVSTTQSGHCYQRQIWKN